MNRFLLTLALCVLALPVGAQSRTGAVRVVDGDTLVMSGERIRLHGINAPESSQACDNGRWSCGRAATAALSTLIAGQPVACVARDTDRYGRTVAVCRNAQGQDLGRALVAQGLATAYRRYSSDYVADEAAARAAGRGVWAGQFEDPESWRHRQSGDASPSAGRALRGVSSAMDALLGAFGDVARAHAADPEPVRDRGLDEYGYGPLHPVSASDPARAPASGPASPMGPLPSHVGLAPPGMAGTPSLSADQLCALVIQTGHDCRP